MDFHGIFVLQNHSSYNSAQMAARIEVEALNSSHVRVRVIEGGGESVHDVTVDPKHYEKLTAGTVEPRELVRLSFQFLLERESKESILSRFDLSVISRYFPEYEREIRKKLV